MARKPVLTLDELKKLVAKLPDRVSEVRAPYYQMASAPGPIRVTTPFDPLEPLSYSTVEFKAEFIEVLGREAIAWLYHDVLVKVTVG